MPVAPHSRTAAKPPAQLHPRAPGPPTQNGREEPCKAPPLRQRAKTGLRSPLSPLPTGRRRSPLAQAPAQHRRYSAPSGPKFCAQAGPCPAYILTRARGFAKRPSRQVEIRSASPPRAWAASACCWPGTRSPSARRGPPHRTAGPSGSKQSCPADSRWAAAPVGPAARPPALPLRTVAARPLARWPAGLRAQA